ncbi:acylpyruvase FAHD1, mitochondrial [Glossina fuscipes]|uniref:oxaloacetate tautomerase n=1 Tax=Glossina fuscipes TaxID=7396 RepID=A0A9C5ZAD1_9MUSC|nr:acylpyruvase FAHD1, mitochondrial [Glossina fuscipes]
MAHTSANFYFRDIIKSRKLPIPEEPILFLKPSTSLIQEGQNIIIPKVFSKVAHEVELACVIGRRCRNVSKGSAMQFVGGYCLALDMTAQCSLQVARSKGMPWSLGKGFDTSTSVSRSFQLQPHSVLIVCYAILRIDLLFSSPQSRYLST